MLDQMGGTSRSRRSHGAVMSRYAALVIALLSAALGPAAVRAQTENPVYVDDSTAAQSTIDALPELTAAGNLGEAVRALQALLDEEPERLLVDPADPMLFTSVRARIHQ